MFEFYVILSRYLFIFYIVFFLQQGVKYILNERKIRQYSPFFCISKQRVCIVFFHLTATLLLAFDQTTHSYNMQILVLMFSWLIVLFITIFLINFLLKNSCGILTNCMLFLFNIGFVTLVRLDPNTAKRQLEMFIVGLVAIIIFVVAFKYLKKQYWIFYYLIALALIISPLLFGEEINGAQNWVSIGGFSFQPSEFAKIFFIFFLAATLQKRFFLPALLSGIMIFPLAIENDFGGALIFTFTFVVMFYVIYGSKWLFFTAVAAISAFGVIAYKYIPHITTRIDVWLNPWSDVSDQSYQVTQALFAIGTYGLLGSGLTMGVPENIPVVTSDFIFAAIAEEFGTLFAILMIVVFMLMFYRCVNIALRSNSKYHILISSGLTSILTFQTFLILGGVTAFIPLTGVTLPFVSSGGSSLITCMIIFGLLQKIYITDKTTAKQMEIVDHGYDENYYKYSEYEEYEETQAIKVPPGYDKEVYTKDDLKMNFNEEDFYQNEEKNKYDKYMPNVNKMNEDMKIEEKYKKKKK